MTVCFIAVTILVDVGQLMTAGDVVIRVVKVAIVSVNWCIVIWRRHCNVLIRKIMTLIEIVFFVSVSPERKTRFVENDVAAHEKSLMDGVPKLICFLRCRITNEDCSFGVRIQVLACCRWCQYPSITPEHTEVG